MNEEIKALVESLRRGQHENPAEKISLLSAALREHGADVPLLLSLLNAPQTPLRLAAIEACRDRSEPELTGRLTDLAADDEEKVRVRLAETLKSATAAPLVATLKILAQDAEEEVRAAAVNSMAGKMECQPALRQLLANDPEWEVRLAAASALASPSHGLNITAWFQALVDDEDRDVRRHCAELLAKSFAQNPVRVEQYFPQEISQLIKAQQFLKAQGGDRFAQLLAWISERTATAVDPQSLAKFGTDLTALATQGKLSRAHGLEEPVRTVMKLLGREPWRSVALVGAAGVGKSALVNELVHELAKPEHGDWRVVRISPSDFMAGTLYVGEWETKVRELIEAVKKPRRVIVYVPNLSDLSAAGTWSKSNSSVATALAPYLGEGTVLLLGESSPEQFERGLGGIPSLQQLFDRVLVSEATVEETRAVLAGVQQETKAPIGRPELDHLLEVSTQFLNHISRPGNAVTLLRVVMQHAGEANRPISSRDILEALSKSTGIPVDLLDDAKPLTPEETRRFFEARIIGQPEAVAVVSDLVMLIKAGLTDPNKPFGVMLFVGPTGVGKTELARALAEFIFGDAGRLKRFDMSEFASADSYARLIGTLNENGQLTDAVRQHPFSVVLLDEIEKSNINVFDLCLQIFDAGRLTDGRGRLVDFRRTIVILTSNIGATAPGSTLGFNSAAGAAEIATDPERTFRELAKFFRPEFLNRIDRIVPFQPLSLEVAEQIARREISLVLQRSGIRRRGLAVEVEPGAVSFLVREGYSPHFGARPLKRTVEKLLLQPLARAIAGGTLRPGMILHVRERGGRLEVSVTSPVPVSEPVTTAPTPASRATLERLDELLCRFNALETRSQPLATRKSDLLQQTREPGFYQNAAARSSTFDEIHKLDQFLALQTGLGRALGNLQERLARHPLRKADEASFQRKLEQLAAELEQLRAIAECRDSTDLGDALICLSLVTRTGANLHGVEKLAGMYRGLAQRRKMTLEVLGEWQDEQHDRVYLSVAALGAFALLKQEAGLHQLDCRIREKTTRTGREVTREDRETIRVEVIPMTEEPDKAFKQSVKVKLAPLKPARDRGLVKSDLALSLFHQPTLRSLELWTNGPKEPATERALQLLHALTRHKPISGAMSDTNVVRHYDLGIAPKVKDTRTGRSTSDVESVFEGRVDLLWAESGG